MTAAYLPTVAPLLAVLAFLALAGWCCHLTERCIRDRCDRPCCIPGDVRTKERARG